MQRTYIKQSFGVKYIKKKIEERQLKWYRHVNQRPEDHMVKEAMSITPYTTNTTRQTKKQLDKQENRLLRRTKYLIEK